MHLQLRRVDEQPRADELLVQLVITQHVTHVLTEEALDAFPEFLNAIGVRLLHAPCPIRRIGRPRSEFPDPRFGAEVRRNIGHQIPHRRKGAHRLYGHRFREIQLAQARHTHQTGNAVDLRRA